ncbi:MAG TPA: GNAT family N-acetyltransferase [Flavipsychrobacter sp.]|nr:GNAT family N-acetyltransferase [Flavipsychrobacter sp.]
MIHNRQATVDDAPLIQSLAEHTWYPTYSPIISQEQIRYMLHHIYNLQLISHQIKENEQTYLLLFEDQQPVGFAGFSPRTENADVYKLHKLYCLVETKGKGYGKALLREVEGRVVAAGKNVLELNVNKYNPAKGFYEKQGYKVIYEEDIPIGDYWMNDFVMRKILF